MMVRVQTRREYNQTWQIISNQFYYPLLGKSAEPDSTNLWVPGSKNTVRIALTTFKQSDEVHV